MMSFRGSLTNFRRYLVSWVISRLFGRCDIPSLRALNVVLGALVAPLCFVILGKLPIHQTLHGDKSSKIGASNPASGVHPYAKLLTSLNVSLFPPLFFFTALYYTDVASTVAVLLSFWAYVSSRETRHSSILLSVAAIVTGLVSLFFRQTNIFWVAVFPAGLSIIDVLHTSRVSEAKGITKIGTESRTFTFIIRSSWENSTVYDVPVQDANAEGCIFHIFVC